MKRLFLSIYDYLVAHPVIRITSMIASFLLLLLFALQVKFEEDVTRFFPDTPESHITEAVFRNLKIKDNIILMIYSPDETGDPDLMVEAADQLVDDLMKEAGGEYIQSIFSQVDTEMTGGVTGFIYDHLPVFLDEEDYRRLDSLLVPGRIEQLMETNYRNLLSPLGIGIKDIILRDPLGIGGRALEKLKEFQLSSTYSIYNGHIFSQDMSTLIMIVTPRYGTGTTGKNDVLVGQIEQELAEVTAIYPSLKAEYFGGPSVSVYNARQIKKDTMLTLSIALVIIVVFITLVFRSRSAIFLIILPVIYGAAFSLACIWFLKGSVSAISIGAGAAVFGVALSYSIHVLSHFNHVTSIRQLISELVYPMTIGSFTTVGAFFGLVFTSSDILRDFGLFSSFALIGTTFFCLVFLPHLLRIDKRTGGSGKILRIIEKINSYPFENNKWLVIGIVVVFVISLFFSNRVTFDSNMNKLSFEPAHIKQAEEKLNTLFESDNKTVLFVSAGKTAEEGAEQYAATNLLLADMQQQGLLEEYAAAGSILLPVSIQQERIMRWNQFWTDERKEIVKQGVSEGAFSLPFRKNAFSGLAVLLDNNYEPFELTEKASAFPLMDNWLATADSLYMFISQVRLKEENKKPVYEALAGNENLVVFDRGYFANKWVSAINDDFYLILYICSFLIFFALLVSYGRIELTLMAFTPMAISWVIILGIMALTGTEFNIVNIILATFIFGLGDDFSIFIMDGLQQDYRTGKKLLNSHKTAIFFSSFTAVVGIGVLVFAKHPALQSLSLMSILGMVSVVLVSYTILPVLFRFFISGPAAKGNYPYTFKRLLITIWFYNAFVVGCSIAIGILSILILVPVGNEKKKRWFSIVIMYMLRAFLKTAWIADHRVYNPEGETFVKPAVIVANHQSFIDILILLSLSPRLIMVTNSWVWNSPVFGRIVRFADFVQVTEGYETVLKRLQKKIAAGYSVVIFPEGTRSADLKIKRFHKGAFYLAEQLKLDIIPVVLYGTGMIISKRQPFYVKDGVLSTSILPRISWQDTAWGATYQERAKKVKQWVVDYYRDVSEMHATTTNPFYYQRLVTNYLFKGPVEEWYIRIKVKMEHSYSFFHQIVPRQGVITDIGCGFGPLSYMLMMLSEERQLVGIDYDKDKIEVANHNFSRNDRIRFVCANVTGYDLPESDVFILNDVLHYMDASAQESVLKKCLNRLLPGGMLLIRDGDSQNRHKHRLTRLTEFLSTRLLAFNKRENDLCFPSHDYFRELAQTFGLELEERKNDPYTSNTIYVLRKGRGMHA